MSHKSILSQAEKLLQLSNDLFAVLDESLKIIDCSFIWQKTTRMSAEQLKGTSLFDMTTRESLAPLQEKLKNQKTIGIALWESFTILTTEGKTVWIEGKFLFNPESGTILFSGKEIENPEVNPHTLYSMLELAKVGSWRVDIGTSSCHWSDVTYSIHEVPIGTPISLEDGINYYVEEHRPVIQECVENAIATGKPWDIELKILTAKKREVWVRAIGTPLFSEQKLIRLEGVFQDIDQAKRQQLLVFEQEKELITLNERFTLAMEASKVGVWDWNIVKDELIWDENMYKLYGLRADEFGGAYEAWQRGVVPEDHESSQRAIDLALTKKENFDTTFRVKWPSGEIRDIKAYGKVIFEKDRPVRMIGANWDITDQVEKEKKLTRATQAARAADEAKSEFLAKMSHEIRTPLNGIMGICSLIKDSLDTQSQKEQLSLIEKVLESGRTLLYVINDILDFSKLEAERATMHESDVQLLELLDSVTHTYKILAKAKGLDFVSNYEPCLDVPCRVDSGKLKQVLGNILGNAVKFTQSGSIQFVVSAIKVKGDKYFNFSVSDTGIGMSNKTLETIFEPFIQADNSSVRSFDGIGLGLSISKFIAELMGGTIYISSIEGQGTKVDFRIRAKAPRKEGIEPPTPVLKSTQKSPSKLVLPKSLRILVAEDNPTNSIVIKGLLKKMGLSAKMTKNGQQCLDEAKTNEYDIILMDCHMPIMDGFEATRKIIDFFKFRPHKPKIIAVTASVMQRDIEKCRHYGMSEVVAKPISNKTLVEAILNALGGPGIKTEIRKSG